MLFGPPASGKDTISTILESMDDRFVLFQKIKVGSGRSSGYRRFDSETLNASRAQGDILSSVERYGNSYHVDITMLRLLLDAGRVPVIHTASIVEFKLLTAEILSASLNVRTVGILLWTGAREAVARLTVRDPSDLEERMDVWLTIRNELLGDPIEVNDEWATDHITPANSAQRIRAIVNSIPSPRHSAQIHRQFPLIVPVPTPMRDGRIDLASIYPLAASFKETGLGVLVGGSVGAGNTHASRDINAIEYEWRNAIGEDRVSRCFWGIGQAIQQLAEGDHDVNRVLVAPTISDPTGWDFHRAVADRTGALSYSHPKFGTDLAAVPIPTESNIVGAKVSKVTLQQIGRLRRILPPPTLILHGSGADILGSLAAGADGVISQYLLSARATGRFHELQAAEFHLRSSRRFALSKTTGAFLEAALRRRIT